jgi:hypothetical protein
MEDSFTLETSKMLAEWNPYDQTKTAEFFDPMWMFGVENFDIVIGNPPYINIENLKAATKKLLFDNYKTCKGRTDIYVAFIEKALSLLSKDGHLNFIIPHSFSTQSYGTLARKNLVDKFFIKEIVDTSAYFVFQSAVVKNIILSVQNCLNGGHTMIKITKSKSDFSNRFFAASQADQTNFLRLKDCRFEVNNTADIAIKEKIWEQSISLDAICFVAYGARLNHRTKKIGKDHYIHSDCQKGDKPFIEGRDIERYHYNQGNYLRYQAKEHYNPMFPELFENEKIVCIRIVKDTLRFALDQRHCYNSHTVINCVKWDLLQGVRHTTVRRNITKKNVKTASQYDYRFLLGILNSRLINWYFVNFLADSLNFYPDSAKALPMPKVTLKEQQPLIDLVTRRLNGELVDDEIDKWVYKLYGLTDEEITLVESM